MACESTLKTVMRYINVRYYGNIFNIWFPTIHFFNKEGKSPLISWLGKKVNLDRNLCLINIFSVLSSLFQQLWKYETPVN